MRIFIALCFLCSLTLYGQGPASAQCHGGGHLVSYSYADTVVKQLAPSDPVGSRTIISMSAMATGQPKLVLRTDGKVFELFRGTLDGNNIYKLLDELEASCRLPLDPSKAVGLIKIKWERAVVSPTEFEERHRAFVAALERYGTAIENRYRPLVKTGMSYMSLHTPQYIVVYDNGYEHLESMGDDTGGPEQTHPIIAWAHMLEKMADKELPQLP